VERNRIKRMIREAFRRERHRLPQGYDLVVIPLSTKAARNLERVRRSLVDLVLRLHELEERHRRAKRRPC